MTPKKAARKKTPSSRARLKKVAFMCYFNTYQMTALRALSEANHRSINDLVRIAVDQHFGLLRKQ